MTDTNFSEREMLGEGVSLEAEQEQERHTLLENADDTIQKGLAQDEEQAKPEEETTAEVKDEGIEDRLARLDQLESQFSELGLGSHYKGLDDVLTKVPEQDRYIRQIQQERAELLRGVQSQPEKKPEPFQFDVDKLAENPREVLTKLVDERLSQMGIATQNQMAQQFEERDATDFMQRTPDFQKLMPSMREKAAQFPGIQQMPLGTAVKVLYRWAKAESGEKTTVTEKADTSKKVRASTSGGTPGAAKPGGTSEITPQQAWDMPLEKLEETLGFSE